MRVLCSGGLYEELEHTECLECAKREVTPPCGFTFPLLNAIFKYTKETEGYHVTSLLGCLLKAHFDLTDPAPRYVHDLLLPFLGWAVHDAVERALPEDFQSEIKVEADGIEGSADIFDGKVVYDIKTVRWLEHSVPYASHADQISAYGELLGAEQQVIQYIDMTGPPRCKKCNLSLVMQDGWPTCPNCGYRDKRNHLGAVAVNVPRKEVMHELKRRKLILEQGLHMAEPSYLCNYCPYIQCHYNPNQGGAK
jgi:hypothetical protein